jgi:hypothetical protein
MKPGPMMNTFFPVIFEDVDVVSMDGKDAGMKQFDQTHDVLQKWSLEGGVYMPRVWYW